MIVFSPVKIRKLFEDRYGSLYGASEALGIAHSTLQGWCLPRDSKNSREPGVSKFMTLCIEQLDIDPIDLCDEVESVKSQ